MLSQKVKLSSIKVNKKNPRKIDKMQFDSLVKSILVFPKMLNDLRPIVVDENMTILGGNMRYRAPTEQSKRAELHTVLTHLQ